MSSRAAYRFLRLPASCLQTREGRCVIANAGSRAPATIGARREDRRGDQDSWTVSRDRGGVGLLRPTGIHLELYCDTGACGLAVRDFCLWRGR